MRLAAPFVAYDGARGPLYQQAPLAPMCTSPSPVAQPTARAGAGAFVSEHRPLPRQIVRPRHVIVSAAAAADVVESSTGAEVAASEIRNIAIIAHVDHGKTTLVDAMLGQSNIFRANQEVADRIMDSNALERERGITILSKNTAIRYRGTKINIIDTPGHADFGGEVERVLNMCDGVLLLVDSVEGPMPQTRFVLRKALQLDKKVIVVVNKIDRPAARPEYVIDATFDLFCELGASDEQCDFPVVYASGIQGQAGVTTVLEEDLGPLFEAIVREVSPPNLDSTGALQMLVTNIDYDTHKGRIAIGRVERGVIRRGQTVLVRTPETEGTTGKVAELFVFDNFDRVPAEVVEAGDICALTGLNSVQIGESVLDPAAPEPLPTISVELPTVSMVFQVNTSPFAGQEGKYVTSRNLKERLERELECNLALRVQPGDSAEKFIVSGRGTLHLGILIENMRREGYEFEVGPPQVILKEENGSKQEPYEEAVVEVTEEYVGTVVDLMSQRKGQLKDMVAGDDGTTRITYTIPTRGLLGIRSSLLTGTRGTAVLNTVFSHYGALCGEISMREVGSLTAFETGAVTGYALESAQSRGVLFVKPGDNVYAGQIVGMYNRAGDLKINVCKKKALTNIRSATKEATTTLKEGRDMGLDDALEHIVQDELVEVTPTSVRMRKNPATAKRR